MITTFSGAVLCGGASARMGRDKATLAIDGQAMAVRVASALHQAGARDVVAIGGDVAALERAGLRVVPDEEPGAGPFPATLTALRRAETAVVVVLSCDLLAPNPETIAMLAARLGDSPAEVLAAVPVVLGEHQWTHAAWRREALEELDAARRQGVASLRGAAGRLVIEEIHGVSVSDVADADHPLDLPGSR